MVADMRRFLESVVGRAWFTSFREIPELLGKFRGVEVKALLFV